MISKEEYWKMIEQVLKEQDEEDKAEFIDCDAWIPAESDNKKSVINSLYGSINATNLKREEIRRAIKKHNYFDVGNFTLFVKYSDNVDEKYPTYIYNVTLYETKRTTASGKPCNMKYKIVGEQDTRFANCPWKTHFTKYVMQHKKNITENDLIDMIKWLQAITKIPAFL